MEKIENFEIDLDISQQDAVYDYVQMEAIRKGSSQSWDYSLFKNRGSTSVIESSDENALMRVKLMDNCIMDTGFLQKKVKVKDDEGDTTSSGSGDWIFGGLDGEQGGCLPRRLLPVYNPGQTVKGFVNLHLKEPLNADALTIGLVGQVVINIRIYHAKGYYDDTRYEEFFKEKNTVWEKSDDKDASDLSDTFNLMRMEDEPKRSKVLPAGRNRFYFEFHVPMDAPQSVPPLYVSTVNYAHLVWRLKAKIDTGSVFKKDIVSHRGILMYNELDIAQKAENLRPISGEEELDTGLLWKSGKIMCKATVKQAGHVRGQPVNVTIELSNGSTTDIDKMEAFVRLYGKARLSDSKLSCSLKVNFKSSKVTCGPIKGNAYEVYKWTLPWDFSEDSADGNLIPVGHLEESKLLDVKYEVVVKLKRKGMHRNLQVAIPLEVGTKNSAQQPE